MSRLLATALLTLAMTPVAWSQDIVIGQSVPLSGSNADIGHEMRDGSTWVELTILSRGNHFVQ